MKVREYLYRTEMDPEKLAELLGFKSSAVIFKRMDEELPKRWVRKLENLSELGMASSTPAATEEVNSDNESEARTQITDEQISDWISSDGRSEDKDPNINNVPGSGMEVIGPQKIKLTTIKGYIEMMYGGAESLARARGDLIAAETIHQYTPEYTEAWIDYIKYDERILKYLEALQIGTPLGNLIGVHAISVGAYVLARVTAKEIAANAAANGNGETEL